ncbi:HEAT repeat domain-containing protein [Meiothermus cerbereus]|uniref:HEAT repeat domain-containing protein n=1 Tax=Meiothermus cerbereus TaxID=65552 RepID=UPI003EEDFDAF
MENLRGKLAKDVWAEVHIGRAHPGALAALADLLHQGSPVGLGGRLLEEGPGMAWVYLEHLALFAEPKALLEGTDWQKAWGNLEGFWRSVYGHAWRHPLGWMRAVPHFPPGPGLFSARFLRLMALALGQAVRNHPDPKEAARALDLLGELLRREDPWVRAFAAEALADTGRLAREAEAILVAALNDPEWRVRLAAAQSLKALGLARKHRVARAILARAREVGLDRPLG